MQLQHATGDMDGDVLEGDFKGARLSALSVEQLLKLARERGVRTMAAEWVQGMVKPSRLPDADLIESILQMFERRSVDTFAAQLQALIRRPDASDVLRALRVPTLIACGRDDAWSPVSQHEAMQRLAGRTRHSILFTFAPRTPILAVMHGMGRLFPRSDRSPSLTPVSEPVLRRGLQQGLGALGWSEGSTQRIKSGFYTSQAWEWHA
jgi:pimeloyl-ACP methyl ester carboxylesterase